MSYHAASKEMFQVGEIVDITLTGVRITRTNRADELVEYQYPDGGSGMVTVTGNPGLNVARVAPAEWPPRPGDVWHDAKGRPWMAVARKWMYPASGAREEAHEQVLAGYGPMTLVHREEAQP